MPLISARFQPQLLITRRAATILYRVRLAASAFAVLTLLWIPVDVLMLDSATSVPVAVARLVTGAAFLPLAFVTRRAGRPQPAPVAVLALILIPCMFFVFAATHWSETTLVEANYGLRGIYAHSMRLDVLVEGDTDQAMATRFLGRCGHEAGTCFGKRGVHYRWLRRTGSAR